MGQLGAAPSPARLLGHPKREGFFAHGGGVEPLAVLQGHKWPEDELVAWPLGSRRRSHTLGSLWQGRPAANSEERHIDETVNTSYTFSTRLLGDASLRDRTNWTMYGFGFLGKLFLVSPP